MRFRKSIKIAPGIRMNFSGRGASWTLGPRGASLGIGSRGTYFNTGIPGTGLYSRRKISGVNRNGTRNVSRNVVRSQRTQTELAIHIEIDDDGNLKFTDSNGNILSEKYINVAKKQLGDKIRELIQNKCDEINKNIESVGEIHQNTPNPQDIPVYKPELFQLPEPLKPAHKNYGCLGSIFSSIREKIDIENSAIDNKYNEQLLEWKSEELRFEESEKKRKFIIEEGIYSDIESMNIVLEETLVNLDWPRETTISTEIKTEGKIIFIDVDLPEIEDMPNKLAVFPKRGYKLSIKEMTQQQIQKLYMRHIHGVGFRIIGEVFAALPAALIVVLSAYSQRANKTTGQIEDEYLYSVRVTREQWSAINFNNLHEIDIVEALGQFDLKREMSKTGIFKPIEPIKDIN